MSFFDGEENLQSALREFMASRKARLGLVSLEAPLISNLSIWSNIALIRQYHWDMPGEEAKAMSLRLLDRLGMTTIAELRSSALSSEQRFGAMLLRAAMVKDAIVVLDRPFGILTHSRDGRFILETLRKLDDLIVETHIFDYHWQKERYGGLDGATD